MAVRLTTIATQYAPPVPRALPDASAFTRAALQRMPTHLDALDVLAAAVRPGPHMDDATRLRTLADIGDLPIGIRPVETAGTKDPASGIRLDAEPDDDHWVWATTALRQLADELEAGEPHAQARVESLLFGPSFHGTPEGRFAVTMRHVAHVAEPAFLPARLPGPFVAGPSPYAHEAVQQAARHRPGGQLAFGSEAARAAIDAARSIGRSVDPRERTGSERARVLDVLARGTNVPGAAPRTVGAPGQNGNGELPVHELTLDPTRPGGSVGAVVKTGADVPFEVLASRVAGRIGADHLVPAASVSAAGHARIELRAGREAYDADIADTAALERSVARGYQHALPLADDDQLAALARHDAQLMRAFDYVLANPDRHVGNVLVDDAGRASWIDHGLLGNQGYAIGTTMRPAARILSVDDPSGRETLDVAVRDRLRRTLAAPDLANDFRRTVGLDTPGKRRMLDGMLARLRHVRDGGDLQWA